jgi:hypothetical protein
MPRAFSSKQLVGNVLRAKKLADLALDFKICLRGSQHCLPWTCAAPTVPCPAGTLDRRWRTGRPPGTWRFDAEGYVRQLDELREDLRAALAELQAHERAIAAPLRTATRLSLDELEAGLKDLLRQVQNRKRDRRDAPADQAP